MSSISAKRCADQGTVVRSGPRWPSHFFGQRLQKSKKVGTSNWASPRLHERQIHYAANDAHVAIRLYRAWKTATEQAAP